MRKTASGGVEQIYTKRKRSLPPEALGRSLAGGIFQDMVNFGECESDLCCTMSELATRGTRENFALNFLL